MQKRKMMFAAGLALTLTAGWAIGTMAEATQIIRMDDIEKEYAQQGSDGLKKASWEEEEADGNRMWGTILETGENRFSFDRQFPGQEGGSEEVIVHIDPESTLVLDSEYGFPADLTQAGKGETVYVYAGQAMTLSLPPQVTAQLVLVGTPQDGIIPKYVTAAGSLADDGQGGFLLKTTGGKELKVPADCPITPYLTRQMVTLADITEGRRCLVWENEGGSAARIVLFNE